MTTSKSGLGALAIAALAAGCGGDAGSAAGDDSGGWGADAGSSIPECFSSSECPVGYTCSEFGDCVTPPPELPHPALAAFAVPTTFGANITEV